MSGTPDGVSVETHIGDAETLIRVSGTRDAALIVESASGEEIYLPPEAFAESSGADSPYDGTPADGPYDGVPADSPYESATGSARSAGSDAEGRDAGRRPVGVDPTPDGFRVYHPEPVTDVRFIR